MSQSDRSTHDQLYAAVVYAQRFSPEQPCPVCGGHPDLPQGTGERCWGYYSDDRRFAYCTREEFAGGLEMGDDNAAFRHQLSGGCACGAKHNTEDLGERAHHNGHNTGHTRGVAQDERRLLRETTYRLDYLDGSLAGEHVRRDYSDGSKTFAWRHHQQRGSAQMPLYYAREALAATPEQTVFVTEGEKACDALIAHGLVAVGTVTGAKSIPCDESLRPLASCADVALWPDADAVGQAHMTHIAARLRALGAKQLRWVTWADAPPKGDAADYFADQRHTPDTLAALIGDDPFDVALTGLPQIVISNRPLREKTTDALRALLDANTPPAIWARSGSLIRLRNEDPAAQAAPVTEPLTADMVCGRLTRVADFLKVTGSGVQQVDPPASVVRDLMALGEWHGIPALLGIVQAPTLRADGSVLAQPGYDPATQLYYAPAPGLTVPPEGIPLAPTAEDVTAARALVDGELLGDFPFADNASHTNMVGLLLSGLVRPAIDGGVPLACIDSPKPGSGKGLLSEINALISIGVPTPAVLDYIDEEREMDKRITSLLARGPAIILLDNIDLPIRSGRLSSALTLREWEGRMIGFSRQIRAPQRAVWLATGNNMQLAGDMPRRAYWIRIDSGLAHPEQRGAASFPRSHYPLLPWVRANRGRLITALLTLARAWFAAGKPSGYAPIMGSFEPWTEVIGGILAVAGYDDFLGNREQLHRQAATVDREWGLFLGAWHQYTRDKASEQERRMSADGKSASADGKPADVTPWMPVSDLIYLLTTSQTGKAPDGSPWPRLEELLPTNLLRVNEEATKSKTLGSSDAALTSALGKALGARVATPFEDPTTRRTLRIERWDRGSRKTFWRVRASEVAQISPDVAV